MGTSVGGRKHGQRGGGGGFQTYLYECQATPKKGRVVTRFMV